jgi:TetR/AcrR family transcriptional regulator
MSETPDEPAGPDPRSPGLPGFPLPAASRWRRRKRPKPGERRVQILQTLATMLEQPGAERITTAALAARLEVSEAALYRHFASKAQMFEGLIEFIETSVFTLVNQIVERESAGAVQAQRIVACCCSSARRTPA